MWTECGLHRNGCGKKNIAKLPFNVRTNPSCIHFLFLSFFPLIISNKLFAGAELKLIGPVAAEILS